MINTIEAAHLSVSEVLDRLQTDAGLGLTEAEVAARQRQHSPNELEAEDPEPLYKKFFDTFKDPLILLLLASCLVSSSLSIIAAHYRIHQLPSHLAITATNQCTRRKHARWSLRTCQNICCWTGV
jgi:magnesium-transporting ATPase (P-type)